MKLWNTKTGALIRTLSGHRGRVQDIAFGPDGKRVAAIDAEALAGWSEDAFALFLTLGVKPDGDFVGGKMEPVIEHNTSRLSREDQQAMAAFFIRGQTP